MADQAAMVVRTEEAEEAAVVVVLGAARVEVSEEEDRAPVIATT